MVPTLSRSQWEVQADKGDWASSLTGTWCEDGKGPHPGGQRNPWGTILQQQHPQFGIHRGKIFLMAFPQREAET